MAILITEKYLKKNPLVFLKMAESLSHTQIYFTGLMRGHQEQKVQ